MTIRLAGAALAAVMACGWASGAKAAYIVDIDQVGGNVVASGSGTLDLSGLTLQKTVNTTTVSAIDPGYGDVVVGGSSNVDVYSGITGTGGFGSFKDTFASQGFGSKFGIDFGQGYVFVPTGYISNTANSAVSTAYFLNTNLNSLGLVSGSYTYELPNDTFTVDVGKMPALPIPAAAPLFSAALIALGAAGYAKRRRLTMRA